MSDASLDCPPVPLLHPECILLEPEDFQRAMQLSNSILGELNQWQVYLQGLALMGFVTWLRERSPNLPIGIEDCSICHSPIASVLPTACRLGVGPFSLCLLAVEQVWDEQVKVPRAVLELPGFTAHFYVVLEVQEEGEKVVIQGFARYDQLTIDRRFQPLSTSSGWDYSIPLDCFDPEPNHLLLYLQMLDPAAIVLPSTATALVSDATWESVDWSQLLTSLQSCDENLWQHLSWKQGRVVLQNPELLHLYDQWRQSSTMEESAYVRLLELLSLTLSRAVQLGQWVRGELDEMAKQLGFFLAPAAVVPMLSIDRFEAAIVELRNQGMPIPLQASCAYQDLDWQEVPLRLCVLTWQSSSGSALGVEPTSSVLFILGMQTNTTLPDGLKLRVSNAIGTLHEPVAEFDDPFLFARVQGQAGDTFVVTICHINSPPLTLAPYQLTLPVSRTVG